ncbi:MAG: hypothetical protein CVV51_13320 [Spirochaetae bacterium HGW-Spirochaetae-7]|nr:MAG: hypothetical protein CVV51_13320 [Spirochaetae bacterium HGW-Spirochaetae-7]
MHGLIHRINVVILAAIVTLALALIAVISITINRKQVVALFGLDEREVQTIRNLVGNEPRLMAVLPSDVRHAEKADVIVTRSGLASLSFFKNPAAVPADIMGRTVPSLRRAVEIDGIPLAMPILMDHFELAWHKDRLSSVGMENLTTMAAAERAMALWTVRRQKSTNALEKTSYAFTFAGGDDETLLLLLSALCLSEGGLSAYSDITRNIIERTPLDVLAGMAIGTSSNGGILTFGVVLDRVVSWNKAGYLHPEWYTLANKDIRALAESNAIFMSAQLLSFHRTVEYKTIARFDTARFPSSAAASERALVAPLTIAI